MSYRDVEKELAKVGRSGLLRLIANLREELAACKLRLGQQQEALDQYQQQLDWQEITTPRGHVDGEYIRGFKCSACGVWNTDVDIETMIRRSACRGCGSKR